MRFFIILILLFVHFSCFSQKYVSEKGNVMFFSSALLEDIEARNQKARSVFNAATGEIVFSIPIKEFKFRKSLMQEHFNEKYMESDKYPKGTFSGIIKDFTPGAANPGTIAEGEFEIHGVKKKVSIPGMLDLRNGKLKLESKFVIKLEDYDIEIPTLLFQNIAEEVEVTISFEYKIHEN